VREVSLGAVPKVSKVRAMAALVRELGRVATTLGEVAVLARRDGAGPAAEAADATLTALLGVVRRLG
jgi:hypothetical protein